MVSLEASGIQRFLYKSKKCADGVAEEWLNDKAELARVRDGDVSWPKTLRTAWRQQGYDTARKGAITRVAYCPDPKCQRRILPKEMLRSNHCVKCGKAMRTWG